MKRSTKKLLSALLVLVMLFGLLPVTAHAEESRTKIDRFEATTNIGSILGSGKPIKSLAFTVTKGAPAYVCTIVWMKKTKKGWEDHYSGDFSSGTWKYRAQVRTDRDNGGASYQLADIVTVVVDGEEDTIDNPTIGDTFSYGWYGSREYELGPSGELVFSGTYYVERSHVDIPITPFSIADAAEGGTPPYTFSKTIGPDWISVSSDGTISGTPITPQKNVTLVVRVTDSKGNYKELEINVGDTAVEEKERTAIDNVEATSDISSVLRFGKPVKNLTFTSTKGSPAFINSMVWMKKTGNGWEDVYHGNFSAGTWKYRAQVRTDSDNGGAAYKLADIVTVVVDGEEDTLDNPTIGDTFSYGWYGSREYVIETGPLSGTVKIKGSVKHYGDLLELEFSGDIADLPASILHYEWLVSDNKATWTNVIGVTGPTYQTPSSGSTTTYARVRVTADGFDGAVYSDVRAIIPPSVTDTFKGTVTAIQDHASEADYVIGAQITATAKNSADIEMTMDGMMYRWQRRADTDAPWEYIPGATGKTYTPTDADENCFIRVEVSYKQLLGELYSNSKWVRWRDVSHTVSFVMQGHGDQVAPQTVHRGSSPNIPTAPSEAGWKFGGWYTEPECLNAYGFDEPVTGAVKLYAKWMEADVFYLTGASLSGTVVRNAGNYILDDKTAKFTWKDGNDPGASAVSFSSSHMYKDFDLTDKLHDAPEPGGIYYLECEIYNSTRYDNSIVFTDLSVADAVLNVPGYSTVCAKADADIDGMGYSRVKLRFELVDRTGEKYPITVLGGGRAYSDKARTNKITEAAVGDPIFIGYDEPAEGKYVADLKFDGVSMDIFEYDGGVIMPARAVTFEVVTADRQTCTVDLSSGSASIPDDVYVYNLPWGASGFSLPTGTRDIDLDGSGKADLKVTWNAGDPTASAARHPDCDITGDYTVKAGMTNTPYKSVTYRFGEGGEPGNPFKDVKEKAYYYEAVLWAVDSDPQITKGTTPTTFEPDATCTRGQVVTFLWRACGCPAPKSGENPFKDVKSGAYYYDAVLWAVENGITKGTSPTTFSPNQGCTRGQVVTFLHRFEGEPAPGSAVNPFNDVQPNAFYYDAVLWAVEKNITKGTSTTAFSPKATCTRGQIVTFLYRDLAKLNVLTENDFFMYIEDVASIPGRGVVVTGPIESGTVRPNDELRLLTWDEDDRPVERSYAVRSLSYDGKELTEAKAGDSVYIMIKGAQTKSEFQKGDVLVSEGSKIKPRTVYIGTLRLQKTEEGGRHSPIFDGYQPNVWLGVGDVHVTVVGLALEGLAPGYGAGNVMLRFDRPTVAYMGQTLYVREGGNTVGEFTVEDVPK